MYSIVEQLTRHACVRGQNAFCARAVVEHFAELTVVFFYENVLPMFSFCEFFHSFD